jgi:hypothetical protein
VNIHDKQLAEDAKKVLAANDRGHYTIPAPGIYPHQWLWDSCFIAIGLRHIDVERAKAEILSMLRGQWSSGMVPHMILALHTNKRDRHKGAWQSWLNPSAPDDVSTSGITQPPLLAEAVVRIGEKLNMPERRSWYKQVLPALIRYHEWLYKERDPHQEGLVLQIHPWETGLDNTPPWMAELHEHQLAWWIRALAATRLDTVLTSLRSDTRYVAASQRLTNVDALALYAVQRRLRRKNYDINQILDHGLFAIEDLAFNSILARNNQLLADIATLVDVYLPRELRDSMRTTRVALENFWDDATGQYYSRDFITHRLLMQPSLAALLPLYSGAISQERAATLVHMLETEHLFGTAYAAPSVPTNSTWFDPNRYWQGPTWVNTNWLLIDGLARYGFRDHASALRETTLELVQKSGFREYYNPLDASGLGAENFSWTAALALDLLPESRYS